ncbi:MAG: anhydro-N-acetylmuramic acid kinase [Chitinispirillales bacterium]|jgi:anhydro-N-acetylmuramic acid kinase|nr:anhydro-N-acetylmuramic acid kinase [Chitinispirillales bacterium]
MSSTAPSKLKLLKSRRALVISAGGLQSGIQVLYLGIKDENWEIFSKSFLPYPQKVANLIERLNETQDPVKLSDLGWLDYKLTMLFLESAKSTLAQAPKSIGEPHYVVLNKPTLWKGDTGEHLQQSSWNLTIGDELYIAKSLGLAVITDFLRHNILAGGSGVLPTFPGSLIVAKKTNGINLFVNIGLVSRMTIIDKNSSTLILESDTGPGTVIIDKCAAQDANCAEGFDRDGKLTSQGFANAQCLEVLSNDQWLTKVSPKQASPEIFMHLLSHPCLKPLSSIDKLATITALTAKSIYDFYRREYREASPPEALWVSGGGVNNLALLDFLSASFGSIPVKSVEELNIPADMKIPLILGLTVDAFISGKKLPWESGAHPLVEPMARWVTP